MRGALVLAAAALVFLPLGGMEAATPPAADTAPILTAHIADVDAPPILADRWIDTEWGLSIVPPAGWVRSPASSLNPLSLPADPVFEVARFQLHLGEPSLYAQPVAPSSGLIADAGAVLSIGVAREGGGLVGADGDEWETVSRSVRGFVASDDDEVAYDGMRTLTRYYFATATDRVVVARLFTGEDLAPSTRTSFLSSLKTLEADPKKQHGPAAPVPAPPAPPAAERVDPSLAIRGEILTRANAMLGIAYVWGGDSLTRGIDCSAWVSRAWNVDRYSTDSIWNVSAPITKEQLLPGDALNLTTGRDPRRLGHIRLFEAWANAAHTLVWVYEATPPRSVHRVIAYDDRYQPIRLNGLSGAGVALIVPGTPAPERTARPAQRTAKPTVKPTPKPTIKVTPRPTVKVTPKPAATKTPVAKTPAPTVKPSPTPTRP